MTGRLAVWYARQQGGTPMHKRPRVLGGTGRTPLHRVGRMLLLITLGLALTAIPARGQPDPASTDEISDATLTAAVRQRLANDYGVLAGEIDVSTTSGIVTLAGAVDHILARQRAVELTGTLRGVRGVIDRLRVEPVSRTDEEIRTDVEVALRLNPAVSFDDLEVEVQSAVVTLRGELESLAMQQAAARAVYGVRGVRDLIDRTSLEAIAPRSDAELRDEIQQRLRADARVRADRITVAVRDRNVTLRGVVGCPAERQAAARAAAVLGVRQIDADSLVADWERCQLLRADLQERIVELGDREIAEAVRLALELDPRVDPVGIQVEVSDHVATLTGSVATMGAAEAAEEDARHTTGVWSVRSHLLVRPESVPPDGRLEAEIHAALQRNPYVAADSISVVVNSGRTYLFGAVDNAFTEAEILRVVGEVPGVIVVSNNLTLGRDARQKSDRQLRHDVRNEIWWTPMVDADEVIVEVRDGIVTLLGDVDSATERREAAAATRRAGARVVINRLKINGEIVLPG
ncbi:MAG: BON domain-containing protein [Candidatus Eisenbacteria bacterium]|nr:BON domain-containing protein [Candidatus Eisenbacteria bacterium]